MNGEGCLQKVTEILGSGHKFYLDDGDDDDDDDYLAKEQQTPNPPPQDPDASPCLALKWLHIMMTTMLIIIMKTKMMRISS